MQKSIIFWQMISFYAFGVYLYIYVDCIGDENNLFSKRFIHRRIITRFSLQLNIKTQVEILPTDGKTEYRNSSWLMTVQQKI